MANMSYCRFENTLRDLRDCLEHMDDSLCEREAKYRKKLIAVCCEISDDYEHELDNQQVEQQ